MATQTDPRAEQLATLDELNRRALEGGGQARIDKPVSYTHLTLPTN